MCTKPVTESVLICTGSAWRTSQTAQKIWQETKCSEGRRCICEARHARSTTVPN